MSNELIERPEQSTPSSRAAAAAPVRRVLIDGLSHPSVLAALGLLGAVLVAGCAVVIWMLRSGYRGAIYVSGLGAEGEPTAALFNLALLVLGCGGVLVALSARGIRTHERAPRMLRAIAPWALLMIASLCFVAASRVTCSAKCPIPSDPRFTTADAIHITLAVAGFALACLAMLLVAAVASSRALRLSSLVAAIAVGVIAGVGGLLSLAETHVLLGGWLEFIAMTLALLWLAWYAVAVSAERFRSAWRSEAKTGFLKQGGSPSA